MSRFRKLRLQVIRQPHAVVMWLRLNRSRVPPYDVTVDLSKAARRQFKEGFSPERTELRLMRELGLDLRLALSYSWTGAHLAKAVL